MRENEGKDTGTGLARFITGKERVRLKHTDGNPRCPVCRFRVRGEGHEQGTHHMRRKPVEDES